MGNFIHAETPQQSPKDNTFYEKTFSEEAFKKSRGGAQEQTIGTLMHLARDLRDDREPDNTLMCFISQNHELLKSQFSDILDELHARACSSSKEASEEKKAITCLIALGGTFPKMMFHFLAKKMDELWNDTDVIFHTIKILKIIIHSNGLPEIRDTCSGLESLYYRQGLLTKMLVIAAVWSKVPVRVAALELLGLVDSMIHERILDLWLERTTQLLLYLKRGPETFMQKDWENMLLLFLEDTIFQISDELWVNYFVQSLILHLSNCSPCEKSFLYKCWGTAMKASWGNLIQPSLWRMIQELRFYDTEEREGFAYGIGICAIRHMEQVISILEEYQCYIDQLLTEHYLMENMEVPVSKEQMRSLLLLGYYFVALLAPMKCILPIIHSVIFPRMVQNYSLSLKDASANSAFIGSVILICKDAFKMDKTFILNNRSRILIYLKNILKETPSSCREVENCQKAIKAITLLWDYDAIEKKEKLSIMDLCISSIMKFPSWDFLEYKEASIENFRTQICYSITFDAVYEIIKDLIEWHMDTGNLHRIITALENWLISPQSHERERATRALAQLLKIFRNHDTSEMERSGSYKGHLIGLLVPSCVHKEPALRYWGKAATALLLNIKYLPQVEVTSIEFMKIWVEEKQQEPNPTIFKTAMLIIKHLPPEELMSFIKTTLVGMLQYESWTEDVAGVLKIVLQHRATELQTRAEILLYSMYYILYSSDNATVKTAVRGIIGTLVHVEPNKTVNTLLTFAWPENWISMLSKLDSSESSSSVENSNLNQEMEGYGLLEKKSESFRDYGNKGDKKYRIPIYHSAHYFPYPSLHHLQDEKYQNNQSETLTQRNSSRVAAKNISFHQPPTVEEKPLPEIRALWMSLAEDYSVYPKVLSVLLSKVPTVDGQRNDKSSFLPCALSAVIWDFIAILEKNELLEGKEDSLFFYCFLSIPGASTKQSWVSNIEWCKSCSPCSVAVQALQNIMKLAKCEFHILDTMEVNQGWDMMIDARDQHKGFAALGRAIRICAPGFFPRNVVPELFPYLYSPREAWRKDCAAFFAEFMGSPYHTKNEDAIMKEIYTAMKQLINDRNNVIKMYGMRGLHNAVHTLPQKIKKEKENILEFYLLNLTDPCYPNIRQEAMSGISQLLSHLSSIRTSTAAVIAMQARSFFNDEDPCIRQSALEVFGQLSKFFYRKNPLFCDQVEKSLGDLLTHMQDDDPEVAEASKVNLGKCARFVRYKPLRDTIMAFVQNERAEVTTFLHEVSRLLVHHCPEKLNKESAFRVAAASQINNYLKQKENKK